MKQKDIEVIIEKNIELSNGDIVVKVRDAAKEIQTLHKKDVDRLKREIGKLSTDLQNAWNCANAYQFMADG